MPNKAQTQRRAGEAWTLSDQVAELRGKYHLKKKDLDAYREGSKADIKKNEQGIRQLRQETKRKHILVADHENGDERVIKTVFRDDRKELLSLQRLTAEGAIDEMDQMMCQGAQFLNALHYERQKREAKLREMEQELARMQHLEQPSQELIAKETEITRLENSLDKAQVKYETASSITRCYCNILDKLREDSLTLPAKLDAMEAALVQQKRELVELKAMAKDARTSRDEAKQQLTETETSAYESKRRRDAELAVARKEVEMRQADSDKTERRAARAALIVDTSDIKALEAAREQDRKCALLTHETNYRRILEAANVTCMEEALERVEKNSETRQRLKQQLSELESQRARLQDEVAKLSRQYNDMKYNGEQKMSRGQRRLEELQQRLHDLLSCSEQVKEQECSHGQTLINIQTGIGVLIDKLNSIKLKPPEHSFTKGDVFERLDLCRKKLEQLMKETENYSSPLPGTNEHFNDPEFQDFLETRIPADNVRIQLEETDLALSFNHIDSEETLDVLTRSDIKHNGQRLIDSKEKPKKRKTKKSK